MSSYIIKLLNKKRIYYLKGREKNLLISSRRNPFTEMLTFTCSQLVSFWKLLNYSSHLPESHTSEAS